MENTQKQADKTKREILLARLSDKYPEEDLSDEEALFGRINGDYDQYDQRIGESRKHEQNLTRLFASDPRSAAFLTSWKDGENPMLALVRNYGSDIKELLDDPDKQDELAEANEQYLAKVAKEKDLEEQYQKNFPTSLEALEKVQQEMGVSDQVTNQAFEFLAKTLDDGIVGIIAPDTWRMMIRAITHDEDVAVAAHTGEVRGRNTKIDGEKLKTGSPQSLPAMMGGQGAPSTAAKRVDMGALERYSEGTPSIWDGAKRNSRK